LFSGQRGEVAAAPLSSNDGWFRVVVHHGGKPMDDLATIFSLNNLPGHLSYVLIAVSYWMTNIFWLRVAAVVGLALEILYFLLSGGDLRAGIGWDLVFIGINLYQLYRLVKDRL
jgi:hypothetical protein